MIRRTLLALALACSPDAHAWAQQGGGPAPEDCFAPAAPTASLPDGTDEEEAIEERIDRLKSPAIRLSRYHRDGWSTPRLWTAATLCWDRGLNAVRLRFAGDRPVDAADLGRILTTPGLLPDFASAGLVVEDVTVEGTLRLEKGTFGFPLDFIRVRFTRPGRTDVRGEEAPVALLVGDSDFEQPVRVTDSIFYGRVFVENTAFDQGLAIEDSDFYIAGRELDPSSSSQTTERSLQLLNTTVGGKLRLDASLFEARIFIDHGNVGYMEVTNNTIGGLFGLRNNVVEKIDLKDNLFGRGVVISNNKVETLLNLQGGAIGRVGTGRDPEIAVNTIGGAFYFSPNHLLAVDRLDLTYADIRGPATIHLPTTWGAHREPRRRKTVDLTSSAVASRLTLCASAGDGVCELPPADAALTAYCPERSADAPLAVIRLTNASLGSLAWGFAPDCRYRWDGVGLQYRFLGDPDAARIEEHAAPPRRLGRPAGAAQPRVVGTNREMDNWRYSMAAPSADALLCLAGHLRSRGEFNESRDVLMEAKALDYAPPARCFRLPEPLSHLALMPYRLWDSDCLRTGAAYAFLLPTGFGVKPEWAFILLVVCWAAGWLLYELYHRDRTRAAVRRDPFVAAEHRMHGFRQYDDKRIPKEFSLSVFSLDALLPVVNLHAYEAYFPESGVLRVVSYAQHVFGWFIVTSLLAALAVL